MDLSCCHMATHERFTDLNEYLFVHRGQVKKTQLARDLGVWPSKLTALLNPDTYRVSLDDDLVTRIAALLNQSPEYVRRLYDRAA